MGLEKILRRIRARRNQAYLLQVSGCY
uniref:Uncharacterized protein n=1 Tax=Anguilla anguilla TaxID=7936 RepID=A0A0E9QHE6_ANGAN